VLILTVGLTLLGIGVIAVLCQLLVAPIVHDAQFDARFTVDEGFFYAGQPAKTMAYQVGSLAAPVLIALAFWLTQRWVKGMADRTVKRITVAGIVAYLALMISCALPIVYCPHPPFWILPPSWLLLPIDFSRPFYQPERLLFLAVGAAVELYFLATKPSPRKLNGALAALLIVWALMIPSRFYVPSDINDDLHYLYHLNSVFDALSQSTNGHHLLVDYPHIYGGYVEMLGPIIALFPRGLGVPIAALAISHIVGLTSLLLIARMVIRDPAVLFVCGLTLLSTLSVAAIDDINYGYLTARMAFAPLGLCATIFYFRRPGLRRYAAATLLAALAPIWNLDTGIVLWLSWTAVLVAMAAVQRNWPGLARDAAIQVLAITAAWLGFFLYLRMASGSWPDVGLLFYFQQFVVKSGYFCLPMLFPDMWVFILTFYVGALAIVFGACARGKVSRFTPVLLILAFFGIGIFSYFMGRSAPSNLMGIAYPAILLAGIFCAEGEALMRDGKLPPVARFLLLPSRIAFFWWSFLIVAAQPDFLQKSAHALRHWNDTTVTPLRADVAFIGQQVKPHEDDVYFLSGHSGIYYYLSDTVRTLRIPGAVELLRTSDMDALLNAIRARQIHKLFVEQNFFAIEMYRPDVYQQLRDAISQNYSAETTGPNGRLVLYTPRAQ
jgi:hypothetical protein